jgi:sugar transferase (PEP-CTERM system associated)
MMLVGLELALLAATFYLGVWLRFIGDPTGLAEVEPLQGKAILYALVVMTCMMTMGLYARHSRDGISQVVLRLVISLLLGSVGMVILFYMLPGLAIGRGAFALVLLFSGVALIGSRLLFQHIGTVDGLKRRILVLGTGQKASVIDRLMRRKADRRGMTIVGYVQLSEDPPQVKGQILPHSEPLPDIVRRLRIQEIVVAVDDRRRNFPVREIVECRLLGIDVIDIISFIERQCGRILIEHLNPGWLIYSEGFYLGGMRAAWKRVFDVVVSLTMLAIFWPLMILAAIAVAVDSPGPILYRQVRVGEHGREFKVLKFRSMTVDAEKTGAQWAQKNDSRVTRFGGFMRKYRIDELPQLFNVLKGEMSFVGPRPERPEFVGELSAKILYYAERHRVKPGITGWAQINYPYGASEKDAEEKLSYDLYYVKNYTLFLDLVILMQTAQAVLWKKGGR